MRWTVGFALSIWLVACAHDPPPLPQIAEVPMYTAAEWADMNSVSTVPEIADNTVLQSTGGFGHFGMHVHSHHFHMHMHH